MKRMILATLLASVMWLSACTVPPWFVQAEGIAQTAVPIAGSVVDIIDPALAPVVTLVENGFSALVNALTTYKSEPTATNLAKVQATFTAVITNESQLEAAAQIKNTKTDAQINGVLQLLQTAVNEIAALVPPQAQAGEAMLAASAKAKTTAKGLTQYDIAKQFNAVIKGDPRFSGKQISIPLAHRL